MNNFDSIMNSNTRGLFSKLSKEFAGLTVDIEEISKHCSDPFFIALLLFQLAREREQTNKLLKEINEKLERIAAGKNVEQPKSEQHVAVEELKTEHVILPQVDQQILGLAEKKGMIEAKDIKDMLGYRGLNAASQRLNKLFREGYLTKVRSGKKVFYLAKSKPLCSQHHPTTPLP
ncbi:MAG: hypothetical protein J7J87_01220 [Candidatus Diapherotrites archaeon]|nr:hypothetical protein [Candidatus Diapherotrites archaeon]